MVGVAWRENVVLMSGGVISYYGILAIESPTYGGRSNISSTSLPLVPPMCADLPAGEACRENRLIHRTRQVPRIVGNLRCWHDGVAVGAADGRLTPHL